MSIMKRNVLGIYCSSSRSFGSSSSGDKLSRNLQGIRKAISDQFSEGYNLVRGSFLEIMAKNISTKDAEFLLQKFGSEIAPNNRSLPEQIDVKTKTDSESNDTANKIIQIVDTPELSLDEKTNNAKAIQNSTYDLPLLHPFLGQMITDLGYKRVYLTNVRSLVHSIVWEKQRILRPQRSALIASEILKRSKATSLPVGVPGIITYFHDVTTDKVGIIDGQHRVGALVTLCQQGHWDEYTRNVLVDVFLTSNNNDVTRLFREINSAEPLKSIDIPSLQEEGELGIQQDNIRAIIDESTKAYNEKYPEMFKPSSKCRPPHVNIDNFREEIFQSGLMEKYKVKSSHELLSILDSKNNEIAEHFRLDAKSEQSVQKAHKYGFFFGLDRFWFQKT